MALNEHQIFLEDSRRFRANGEWRLGRELFSEKLELVLNAGLSAAQVLADAEAEFIRVQREMYVVSRQLWSHYFPNQTLPPDDESGRRETIAQVTRAVSQEHGKPEDLVTDARALLVGFRTLFGDTIFCVSRNRIAVRSLKCRSFDVAIHWRIWTLRCPSIQWDSVRTPSVLHLRIGAPIVFAVFWKSTMNICCRS